MDGPQVVAGVLAAVFAAIAAVHVYWAARGASAASVDAATVGGAVPVRADGTPLFTPGPLATLAVAVLLAAAAVVVLGRAGVVAPVAPAILYRAGTWVLGCVLLLRAIGDFRYVGIFRRERHSRFAAMDTVLYTPLCALLAAGVFYLAAN
jgi:hypothetical protein